MQVGTISGIVSQPLPEQRVFYLKHGLHASGSKLTRAL